MTTDARKLPVEGLPDLRRRAVNAVLAGEKKAHVAKLFGIGRTTLMRWMQSHEELGDAGLENKKRGRPAQSRLRPPQVKRVCNMICDRCPDQLKLPFALWTREAVGQLLESHLGIKVSVWTVGRYLRSWGFTPQKPVRRAYERDPEAVQEWLDETYPALQARAKAEGGVIHWGDEMGLRSDHQTGRSYGLKGVTPVVYGTGQRFGCSMISTITNRGEMAFMVFHESFTARVFIKFLRRLLRHAGNDGHRIFLIVDSHPVHKSRLVKQWMEKHSDHIEMHFLPGYSPELNPDELLNQDTKANVFRVARPRNKTQMVSQVRTYLRSTQKRPDIIINYFREKHVQYAAGELFYI